MIYGWIRKYRVEHNKMNVKTEDTLQETNKRLLKENALLCKEKEILNKAFVCFARETL